MQTQPLGRQTKDAPRRDRRAGQIGSRGRRHLLAMAFVLPALIVYGGLVLYPMLASLLGAFFEWTGAERAGLIGITNFRRLLSAPYRSDLVDAFWHNVLWFAGVMIVQSFLGLLIAWTLFRRGRRFRFFRSIYFFPALLSPVLVGTLWKLIFTPNGPAQSVLQGLGLDTGTLTWLGDPGKALWILIAVDAWNWIGLPILVFTAALHAIPREILEAAALDGATAGRMLRSVSVPMMIPALASITTLTVINAFNQFDIVYVMEGVGGDPSRSTDLLVTQFYRFAFGAVGSSGITDIGLALSLGALLFMFLAIASIAILRFFDRRAAAL